MQRFKLQSLVLVSIAFILGFSEFIMVGILNDLSRDFHVPVATVGYLVTAFALVYAISTPIITIAISKYTLFRGLMLTMSVFTVGNILTIFATNFGILTLARIITALVSGVIISLALAFSSYIAPMEKRSWLVSWVFSGFSIASVFGVPVGTFISTHFGWRNSFVVISILSVLTMIMIFITLPRDFKQKGSSIKKQLVLLTDRRIQLGMLIPMFSLGGMYVFYTYLRPIITTRLAFNNQALTGLLFIFGIASIFGNQMSGRINDYHGIKGLKIVYQLEFLLMIAMPLAFMNRWVSVLVILGLIFAMPLFNAPMQLHFLRVAETDYPQSLVLASSLNSIFCNFGIALGSATGSLLVSNFNLNVVGPGGAVYVLVALGLVIGLQKAIANHDDK